MSKHYDLTRPLGNPEEPGQTMIAEVVVTPGMTGWTFLNCLERSPLGEIWKVRGPDFRVQIAYYLRAGDGAGQDWRLDRLRLFHHPDLPGFEIIEADPGRTVLLTDGYELTLLERFTQCWSSGQPGIPRAELLGYLRTAAEALDAAHVEHAYQHLGLNPSTVWLENGRAKVGGFGLIPLFWVPMGRPMVELNPRYCAPELSRGHIGRRCDQYALALIYAEMLTGVHPLEGPVQHRRKPTRLRKPDLNLLATPDQQVVARALSRRPSQRFASCTAFVQALEEAVITELEDRHRLPAALAPVIAVDSATATLQPIRATTLNQFIMELVALAAGPGQLVESQAIRYRLEPGRSLEHRCAVELFPGAIALKLEGFRQRWSAQQVDAEPGQYRYTVSLAPGFWQRLMGKRLGLEIQIQLAAGNRNSARRMEVSVVIRPFGCNEELATRILAESGPSILESIRCYLQACPEQRGQHRLSISQPLRVQPVLGDMQLAQPIECMGKDISTHGIGFFLPHPPVTNQVYINVPELPQVASVAGLAHIVRGQPCGDGWYEVGAFFVGDGPGKK